jgi:hypothetical protein
VRERATATSVLPGHPSLPESSAVRTACSVPLPGSYWVGHPRPPWVDAPVEPISGSGNQRQDRTVMRSKRLGRDSSGQGRVVELSVEEGLARPVRSSRRSVAGQLAIRPPDSRWTTTMQPQRRTSLRPGHPPAPRSTDATVIRMMRRSSPSDQFSM